MVLRISTFFLMNLVFLTTYVTAGTAPEVSSETGAAITVSAQAQPTDTLYMKNGSILHGVVVSFENEIFTIVIPGTSSRAMIHVDDVERIEFAELSSPAGGQPQEEPQPENQQPVIDVPTTGPPLQQSEQAESTAPPMGETERPPRPETARSTKVETAEESTPDVRQPATSPPAEEEPAPATQPQASRDEDLTANTPPVEPSHPEQEPVAAEVPTLEEPASTPRVEPAPATTSPLENQVESSEPPAVRELVVKVAGGDVWADSGVDVIEGARLRLAASGQVNLSPTLSTGPEGVNIADPRKMMPGRPTGCLIAVIGDDNDDFIYIGATAEFVAQRGGRLFLMVNEDNLNDNSGAFNVRIQLENPPEPHSA